MTNEELKKVLNGKHINSWVKYYKDDPVVQDHLFSLYGIQPSTDSEIYAILYLVMHDLESVPLAYCGEKSKFVKYGRGYAKFCNKYDRSLKEQSCAECHKKLYEERNKKSKVTNLEKYGNEIPQRTDVIKQRVKDTNLEKYGVESHNSTQEVKDKKTQTMLQLYGVENPGQMKTTRDAVDAYWLPIRYNIVLENLEPEYTPLFDEDDLSKFTSFDKLPYYCGHCKNIFEHTYRCNRVKCTCQMFTKSSSSEKDILQYIKTLTNATIIENERSICAPKELDIYIPELKLAFEYNGVYWHSHRNSLMTKKYHQEKVLKCKEQGINLIHIFEDEWNDDIKREIIKSRIRSKIHSTERIFARKCQLRSVDKSKADSFCDEYHIQGSTNASIHLGLYYNDELVALMTFGKSRFDKSIDYELIRYCSSGTVVGGASKLLKEFEKQYKPKSLLSYADMNWSNGNLYEKLGFDNLGYTEPGYFYYDPKNKTRISRQKCQKHKLVKAGFDSQMTETEICCGVLGYYKIYDSGNWKFTKHY